MKRPTHRIQTSTTAGATTILGLFLSVFNDVKIENTFDVIQSMSWAEIIPLALALAGGLMSMFHNEKPKAKEDD